jgi:hypothetical protein
VAEAIGEVNEAPFTVIEVLTKPCGSGLARESNLDDATDSGSTSQRKLAIDLPSAPG